MLAGLYREGDTVFHRLDPRPKLAWTLLVLAASMATQFNGLKSFPVFVSVVLSLALAGIGVKIAFLLIFNASIFLLVTLLIWVSMYSSAGVVLARLGWLTITDVGLLVALGKFFLIMNPVIAFVVFFASTKPSHIIWALQKIGVPYKLAFSFVVALGLLPSIIKNAGDVIDVQKARGLALDRGNIFERIRRYAPILIPLISRMMSDVWDLSMVLASRGFGYAKKRTFVDTPSWGRLDTLFLLLSIAFYGGIAVWGLYL